VTDYMHELHFGVFIPPVAARADQVLATAMEADLLGLDLVSVQDHPYQPAFLDAWTLLTTIVARTERVTVLPNVANLPLRPPAVLARSAASLDILSNGRVELGLGAGAFWDAIEAMGGPRRSPREAVDALEEAIAVIRALWTEGRTPRIDGEHYSLRGAKPGPFPVHDIGIWLGAYKRRMLQLTGRSADGWLPSLAYAPPGQLTGMNALIDDAALAAGRSPKDIKRLYNISGTFAGNGFLQGPAATWVEQLAGLALSEGISGFILDTAVDDRRDLHRFAEEVVPGVRELVEAERLRPESEAYDGPPASPAETTASPVVRREDLGVIPTPEPAQRFSATTPWDETSRPEAPTPDERTTYTDQGRADGQHLIDIHDHLRQELAQIRDLVEQVARGHVDIAAARGAINTMTMRQNNWTLGTYCESYCRVVTTHHTIEDVSMFPRLRHADPRLGAVIDRLEEEHHAIAEVLEGVDAALVQMVADPEKGLGQVQDAVDLLTDTLLSHLSYEERELVEPLARIGLT
jgi:hemerythrin-like domain-containing protein